MTSDENLNGQAFIRQKALQNALISRTKTIVAKMIEAKLKFQSQRLTNGLKFFQIIAKAQILFSPEVCSGADEQIAKWEILQCGCFLIISFAIYSPISLIKMALGSLQLILFHLNILLKNNNPWRIMLQIYVLPSERTARLGCIKIIEQVICYFTAEDSQV